MTRSLQQAEYDGRFLARLREKRPNLVSAVGKRLHEGIAYVTIDIPPPEGQEDGILISTYGCELTMFYHAHHAHFDMFADGDEQDEFDEFFAYVDDFMNERLVAVSEFNGEKWGSSCDASPVDPVEPKDGWQVIVKSWKGTYSKVIE